MTVSIIIAVKTWQNNLEECVGKCRELDFPRQDFEIIVLPDEPFTQKGSDPFWRVVPTGPVGPAEKRDIALLYCNGELIAFLDDDAYPRKDWLKNAVRHFADPDVGAVGGPAVTPPHDTLRQKASGLVYSSFLVSGSYSYRYLPKAKRLVDDYPSCNFFVRKSLMEKTGGFQTNFWPGEDTKLCLDITKKFGQKIVYDPEVLVYHHRRKLFKAHLKQIASYGLHRGYFVKRFPETSLRISYFLPSILVSGIVIGGMLSLLWPLMKSLYLGALAGYLVLAFIFSIYKDLRLIPLIFFGIIITHFAYGVYFLRGLLSGRLKEEVHSP
jgi:cellulose synthase/poly-beta-1,6-N-acetylglucosamine synthase-like glycosyltransferase